MSNSDTMQQQIEILEAVIDTESLNFDKILFHYGSPEIYCTRLIESANNYNNIKITIKNIETNLQEIGEDFSPEEYNYPEIAINRNDCEKGSFTYIDTSNLCGMNEIKSFPYATPDTASIHDINSCVALFDN